MKSPLFFVALFFAGACLATESTERPEANEPAQPEVASTATEEPKAEDRMICERKKRVGSNRIERICMTESQREAARQRARDEMERRDG